MSTTPLTIYRYKHDSTVVLKLCGELDISTSPAFSEAVKETLDAGPDNLLLDIEQLEFVDSTGLRAMLATRAVCSRRPCEFAITTPTPSVRRLFELTGIGHLMPFRRSELASIDSAVQLWPPLHSRSDNGYDGHLTAEDASRERQP
jgi:anti-anti-sigma factor